MIRSSIDKMFGVVWAVLLTTGAAGGLTFLMLASGLAYVENRTEKLLAEKPSRNS